MALSRSVIPVTILITFLVLMFPGSGARAFNVQLTQHLANNGAIPFTTNGLIMGQVIIEFNSFAEARAAQAANIIPGVTFDRGMSTRPVARYNITDGSLPSDVIIRLSALSNIREVFPNYKRSAAKIPNDPYFQLQEEDLRLVRLPDAWDIETGSADILVGVIDTGVDDTHPDLIPNMVFPGVNVREDWEPDRVTDDSGHGTAVCGVIGAVGNNGMGVAGTSWDVRMLAIRACGGPFLDCDLFDEVEGIDVARERGCDVINLSIGGVGTISLEENAVKAAYDAGIVIVAAAGNADPGWYFESSGDWETDRHSLYFPAALPEVIGVGAVGPDGEPADFSNYGEDILSLMAPGVEVVTTVPDYECYLYTGVGPPYGKATGTSFSTPMVSGVAALILSHFPGLTPDEVRARLENTAIPMVGPDADFNGINDYYGYGLLNAYGALSQAGSTGNQYLQVGVSRSPIFADELIVIVQSTSILDEAPIVRWTTQAGDASGSFQLNEVSTRPGLYIGTFHPGVTGTIKISVSAISNGAPVPLVNVNYVM
jgi:subtilisin family serine protease